MKILLTTGGSTFTSSSNICSATNEKTPPDTLLTVFRNILRELSKRLTSNFIKAVCKLSASGKKSAAFDLINVFGHTLNIVSNKNV